MTRRSSGAALATLSILLVGALAVHGGALANDPGPSPSIVTSPAPGSPAVAGAPVVEGAWARVSPMIERAGAAYMVIRSQSAADDALIGATSPAAGVVEMHRTEADASGMMTMHPVPEIPLPASGSADLAPGGYHLMLIDLVQPLVEGTDVELVLTFRSGAVVTVQARVGSGAPMASPMMSPGGMTPPSSSPGASAPASSPMG